MTKFQAEYTKFLTEHTLVEQAKQLYNELPTAAETGYEQCPFTKAQAARYNHIEALRVEGLLLAEQKCGKYKFGVIDWSPEYQSIMARVHYWNATYKKAQGKPVNTQYCTCTV